MKNIPALQTRLLCLGMAGLLLSGCASSCSTAGCSHGRGPVPLAGTELLMAKHK